MEREKGKKKKDPYEELVEAQHAYHIEHAYEWLTDESVGECRRKYGSALQRGENEVDAEMKCRMELQQIYGLTELEATNVLRGYHARDYISKYRRIRELIPIVRMELEEFDPEKEE